MSWLIDSLEAWGDLSPAGFCDPGQASITAQAHAFRAFRRFRALLERACSKKRSRRASSKPQSSKMLARRASSKPQELENASSSSLFEAPGARKCSLRASSKPQRLENAREKSLFEPLRSGRARICSKRMLEEAVEAAVEDASKLFRSRWPRSGLAGSDFARSRSATTRGQ